MFSSDYTDDSDSEGEELMMSSHSESEKDGLLDRRSRPTRKSLRTAGSTSHSHVALSRDSSADIEETNTDVLLKTGGDVSPQQELRTFSPTRGSAERSINILAKRTNSRSIIFKTEHSKKSTRYEWLLTSFAAVGGFLFGYDTGVVSGAMLLLRKEFSLSTFWQEVIVSVTIGTAFLSALAGGPLNDIFGRRVVTLKASFVFTLGALILGTAANVAMLVVGRAILGIGIGFASMTVPVYIAECAPAHIRGRLVTVNTLFITGGQCLASIIDGAFSYVKPDGWRFMLGLAGLPSLVMFLGFLFLPESPRWLLKKERSIEARAVLVKLRGTQSVDWEIGEIKEMLEAEKAGGGRNTLIRIMTTPSVRRALFVGCGLQLFQQLSGINTVMYYSATIIKMAGISDEHNAIWLAAVTASVNFLFTIFGVWLVEKIGRKRLLILSMLGVILSLAVMAVAFQMAANNSPLITDFDPEHSSIHCYNYKYCEGCIEDLHCGFCYTEEDGMVNGSCVSTHPVRNPHGDYGQCENSTLPAGVVWAYDFCPTPHSWLAILGLVLYLMFFAPGMGPMPWTINSEIYPLWARSMGNSFSAATNWIANLVVSMTFLTMTETMTKYGTYWLFMGFTSLGLVFIIVCLPETKGKRLEDVQELFDRPLIRWKRAPTEYRSLAGRRT